MGYPDRKFMEFIVNEKLLEIPKAAGMEISRIFSGMRRTGMPNVPEQIRKMLDYDPPDAANPVDCDNYDNKWRETHFCPGNAETIEAKAGDDYLKIYALLGLKSLDILAHAISFAMEKHEVLTAVAIHASPLEELYDAGEPFGIVYAIGPGIVKSMDTDKMGEAMCQEIRETVLYSQAPKI